MMSLEYKNINGRILLVEDVKTNQIIISEILSSFGCVVDIADNGKIGVEKAIENEYDIILMDLRMPVMDGFEATEKIFAHYKKMGKHVPIVAITAFETNDYRMKCLSLGMNDFITKPVSRDHLYSVIREWFDPSENVKNAQDPSKQSFASEDVYLENTVVQADVVEELFEVLPDAAKEVINFALQDIDGKIKLCKTGVENNDFTSIFNACHSMKSVAATVGADRFSAMCNHMSDFCNMKDIVQIKILFKSMIKEFEVIYQYFNEFFSTQLKI